MAYSALSDSQIDGDSPLIADTMFKLRDNPIAIANGDVGAPRVQAAALDTGAALGNIGAGGVTSTYLATGSTEINWVLARTAGASAGAVGAYAFLRFDTPTNSASGVTSAGSALRYSNANGGSGTDSAASPSGTWRLMGNSDNASEDSSASLFLRIS